MRFAVQHQIQGCFCRFLQGGSGCGAGQEERECGRGEGHYCGEENTREKTEIVEDGGITDVIIKIAKEDKNKKILSLTVRTTKPEKPAKNNQTANPSSGLANVTKNPKIITNLHSNPQCR